jgi:hypothetical protein
MLTEQERYDLEAIIEFSFRSPVQSAKRGVLRYYKNRTEKDLQKSRETWKDIGPKSQKPTGA